jgi:hypothetical protein
MEAVIRHAANKRVIERIVTGMTGLDDECVKWVCGFIFTRIIDICKDFSFEKREPYFQIGN